MQRKTKALLGAAAVFGMTLGVAGTASADYAPSGTDVLGVGGDTPQLTLDFAADGDYLGDLGYNAANNVNKLVSIDATADGNGRPAYPKSSTTPLNPTVVYRAGTSPVLRVPSTTDGYNALIADTGAVHQINFIRTARPPKAAEQTAAGAAANVGTLHVVQIADDGVEIAAANVTNAPNGLTINDLLNIYTGNYTTWNQIPGNSGGSTATIIPGLPPSTSAINSALLNALKAANGGVAPTLSASVVTVEQNDATALNGPNIITPFSTARLNLWNTNGYFKNPNTAFPGGAPIASPAKAVTGGALAGWTTTNGIFIVYRESDAAVVAGWQPGSTKNWVKTLFADAAGVPFFKSPGGQALIAAAGDTPNYSDKGAGYSVG